MTEASRAVSALSSSLTTTPAVRLTRAALYALGVGSVSVAAVSTACGGATEGDDRDTAGIAIYGAPPVGDAGDANPVPFYGAPPMDDAGVGEDGSVQVDASAGEDASAQSDAGDGG